MLKKIHRLRKSKDYKRLVQNSRSYRFGALSVRVKPNQKNTTRVGVVAGIAISKKAVVRNRVRRQLQEIARLFLKEGKVRQGFDIMVRPDARAIGCPYNELREMLGNILQRVGVYVN